MNFKIKKFDELNTKELYEILSLRNEVFVVEQNCPYQDIDSIDFNSYHIFLEKDDQIVSYLRIMDKEVNGFFVSIGRVLVKENFRKNNIANEMIKFAMNFIFDEMNESSIKLSAQTYLLDFYKNHGFIEISSVYKEDGIDHIDMVFHKI
ncbi:MAG: GNAT family N-acetyltransferase [Peptostreptococcaceae bacterium]